ncbi:MAG: RNA methyltransferase [Betaproteobacteria bacterium]|nr:RNA methyltransferase [Betaproteobacteria bacterium]
MSILTSRDNPRVRRWRELARDARERRKLGRAIIEGENLIVAFLESGREVESLMLSKTASIRPEFVALATQSGAAPTVLSDSLFRSIVDVETPFGIAAEIAIPTALGKLKTVESCVLLDAVQDTGNVGTMLRSAAAFGIRHAVLGSGCADAWSPKVLRAAAGAHFSLQISETADLAAAMAEFGGRIACTMPRDGVPLAHANLSGRIGWLFGSEGKGVHVELAARAALKVTIPMLGGAESLNVAAAAAICFYEFSKRGARA